jgi:hypothetical protein
LLQPTTGFVESLPMAAGMIVREILAKSVLDRHIPVQVLF